MFAKRDPTKSRPIAEREKILNYSSQRTPQYLSHALGNKLHEILQGGELDCIHLCFHPITSSNELPARANFLHATCSQWSSNSPPMLHTCINYSINGEMEKFITKMGPRGQATIKFLKNVEVGPISHPVPWVSIFSDNNFSGSNIYINTERIFTIP